ncbi:hypothetical protein P8452_68507 [Trifolium repens]|nr:hypothetical protein P8452_68507 [Trifolium repens]
MWYLLTNLYKSLHKKYPFQTCLILPVVKFGSNEYFLKLWLNMLMGRMENIIMYIFRLSYFFIRKWRTNFEVLNQVFGSAWHANYLGQHNKLQIDLN